MIDWGGWHTKRNWKRWDGIMRNQKNHCLPRHSLSFTELSHPQIATLDTSSQDVRKAAVRTGNSHLLVLPLENEIPITPHSTPIDTARRTPLSMQHIHAALIQNSVAQHQHNIYDLLSNQGLSIMHRGEIVHLGQA